MRYDWGHKELEYAAPVKRRDTTPNSSSRAKIGDVIQMPRVDTSGQWHKPESAPVTRRKAPVDSPVDTPVDSKQVSTQVSTEQKKPKYRTIEAPDVVEHEGHEYNRDEHPMFFAVVDWLNNNRDRADIGVRKIAAEIEVSKSYVAVARNWWRARQAA